MRGQEIKVFGNIMKIDLISPQFRFHTATEEQNYVQLGQLLENKLSIQYFFENFKCTLWATMTCLAGD